ncbi:hypothetical protein PIB30_059561 [Stylosanthes scabra]|uniref:Uncharacterized protein n=1 Tax=Stylosanthes scabra TaxID=79078 RepID=A0ABU6ZJ17_9FABA|nr:hypothetical protein [Stylosanthes scabra]
MSQSFKNTIHSPPSLMNPFYMMKNRLIGIEKGIKKAKEGIEEQNVHKRKPKSEKQGTVRSHGPIVRPHMSLGAFRDASYQYPRHRTVSPSDRAGA